MLAMKLCAWRDGLDRRDAQIVLVVLGGTKEAVWVMVEPPLSKGDEAKAWYALEELWELSRGAD